MKPWVAYLAYLGISKGSNGLFSPASNITRAQAAVLILRTLDVGKSFGATVPTVTSINPTTGAAAGGTVVLITGTNFTSDATVKFGTKAATNVTFNSATQISGDFARRHSQHDGAGLGHNHGRHQRQHGGG